MHIQASRSSDAKAYLEIQIKKLYELFGKNLNDYISINLPSISNWDSKTFLFEMSVCFFNIY